MKETCWKNKDFTRTFVSYIKVRFILILKIKINAYFVSCCDVRKCIVSRNIILSARASYTSYKQNRGNEGYGGNKQKNDLWFFKKMCRKKSKEENRERQGRPQHKFEK